MGKIYFIPFALLFFHAVSNRQEKGILAIDSLKNKSYKYFEERLSSDELDPQSRKIYSAAYLEKAKAEKNWKEMVLAYKAILHQSEKHDRIVYADSMILAAKHTSNDDLIGSAYLTKGIAYYDLKDFNNALDNYLIADGHITIGNDEYLEHKVKYNIAQIKYYLGFYGEASALFSQCVSFFKDNDDIPYLTSLHSLGFCYNRLGKFDLCTATNDLGISEAERLGIYDAIPRFINSEGINQYFKKNYKVSIAKLQESLPHLVKNKDFANEAVTNFYLGKNFWAQNQPSKAIEYFAKVDSVFTNENYIRPDLRENYELLIDYYKSLNDLPNQLHYIDQLLLADKFLETNYKYLSNRIHKEYDIHKLLASKNEIEHSLQFRNRLDIAFGFIILILAGIVCYLVYRSLENKRKFKKLMARKDKTPKPVIEKKPEGELDINPEVVASVLKGLDKFERTEKYLAKDITLPKLANMFDSNIVYVSKIISHHKNKKSIDYINDLKVDYIIGNLRTNSKFRNYTNKALGEEAGFSTTQHFTRAFSKNTGISPTYFVQELKKTIATGKLE